MEIVFLVSFPWVLQRFSERSVRKQDEFEQQICTFTKISLSTSFVPKVIGLKVLIT